MILSIFTDGGSRGNPGHAAIGVVIKNELNKVIHSVSDYLGTPYSCNYAEYSAAIRALEIVKSDYNNPDNEVRMHLDSALVVGHVTGKFRLKADDLKPLFRRVMELLAEIACPISWQHVPREKNQLADAEVNKAFKEFLNKDGSQKFLPINYVSQA